MAFQIWKCIEIRGTSIGILKSGTHFGLFSFFFSFWKWVIAFFCNCKLDKDIYLYCFLFPSFKRLQAKEIRRLADNMVQLGKEVRKHIGCVIILDHGAFSSLFSFLAWKNCCTSYCCLIDMNLSLEKVKAYKCQGCWRLIYRVVKLVHFGFVLILSHVCFCNSYDWK